MPEQLVGSVSTIARYPVKSMRGEVLESVPVGFNGIPLDRAFAFVQDGDSSPFPWLTGRECPQMLQCQPTVADGSGRWPKMSVATPGGAAYALESPELAALLEEWSGRKAHLHSDHRGNQDVAYISIITAATVRALTAAGGVPEDHRRFRMNFTIDAGDEPFVENGWVGRHVRIGGAVIAVHERDRRCQMITLDPETGASTPAVLKQCGELNGAFAGVYGSVLVPGEVRSGDTLIVE